MRLVERTDELAIADAYTQGVRDGAESVAEDEDELVNHRRERRRSPWLDVVSVALVCGTIVTSAWILRPAPAVFDELDAARTPAGIPTYSDPPPADGSLYVVTPAPGVPGDDTAVEYPPAGSTMLAPIPVPSPSATVDPAPILEPDPAPVIDPGPPVVDPPIVEKPADPPVAPDVDPPVVPDPPAAVVVEVVDPLA